MLNEEGSELMVHTVLRSPITQVKTRRGRRGGSIGGNKGSRLDRNYLNYLKYPMNMSIISISFLYRRILCLNLHLFLISELLT